MRPYSAPSPRRGSASGAPCHPRKDCPRRQASSLRRVIIIMSPAHRLFPYEGGPERHPERAREVGVSLAVYDVIVPTMLHGLYVLDNFLDHAQALERSKRMDPGTVLAARLAPDMLTFGEQFSVSCDKVEAHVVKLLGRDCPAPRA